MKQKFLACLLAIVVGFILSIPIFIFKPVKNNEELSFQVLQVGVYSNLENASIEKNKFEDAIIYEDNGFYRVLVGASTSKENMEKIKKVLEEQNISYYQKELKIVTENKNVISNYNLLLEKAEEKETILLLNQKILENMVNL